MKTTGLKKYWDFNFIVDKLSRKAMSSLARESLALPVSLRGSKGKLMFLDDHGLLIDWKLSKLELSPSSGDLVSNMNWTSG